MMKQKNNVEFNKLILLNFFMLIFFVIMLLIGTFNDEAISKTLYSPDNLPLKLVTAIGAYPLFFQEACLNVLSIQMQVRA